MRIDSLSGLQNIRPTENVPLSNEQKEKIDGMTQFKSGDIDQEKMTSLVKELTKNSAQNGTSLFDMKG